MKRGTAFVIVIVLASLVRTAAAEVGAGIKAGTLGFGIEANYAFNSRVSASLGVNKFTFGYSETEDGIAYDLDLDLQSLAVLLNVHPGVGWFEGFRFTGGMLINDNEIAMTARSSDSFAIGESEYTAAQIGNLTGYVDFNSWVPYLGLGWGNPGGRRWGFTWDLGILFQGEPDLSLVADGPISDNEDFMADLALEIQDAQQELDGFEYYPVVAVGFYFHF